MLQPLTRTPRLEPLFVCARILRFLPAIASLLVLHLAAACTFADGITFRVAIDPAQSALATSGRLVIAVIAPGAKLPPGTSPHDAPFWEEQHPMYGLEVRDWRTPVTVDDTADWMIAKPSQLKPGKYYAAARFIRVKTNGDWKRDAGNIKSSVIEFDIAEGPSKVIDLKLDEVIPPRTFKTRPGLEVFELRSTLLSNFHKRDVILRAAVGFPSDFDPTRKYAALYEVPGFGGDHFTGQRHAQGIKAGSPRSELLRNIFIIYLDPESPNGHTLFADSLNNGPRGQALTEEFIPALEKKYPLLTSPNARLLRGHSSGGWSTLWLALNYSTTFGAAWPSSPDPIDFRRFQLANIYEDANMYAPVVTAPSTGGQTKPAFGSDHVSYQRNGKGIMTIRQENAGERITGPNQTSGMQWASWQAVAGARNPKGHPAALYDSQSGEIDKTQLEQWKKYDIGLLVKSEPQKYLPILRQNVRLVCGDADNFFLHEAVKLLKEDSEALAAKLKIQPDGPGYITLVPGLDHGTIFRSAELRAFDQQMLDHLRSHNLLREPAPKPAAPQPVAPQPSPAAP